MRFVGKLIAVLMCLALAGSGHLFPASALAQGGQPPISYFYVDDQGVTQYGVCTEYTMLSGELAGDSHIFTDGWYVVTGEATCDEIKISGNVNLILSNIYALMVNGWVHIKDRGSLSIYTDDYFTSGDTVGDIGLVVENRNGNTPALGSGDTDNATSLTIHSGTVTVRQGGDEAAIGGRLITVNILGGTVNATVGSADRTAIGGATYGSGNSSCAVNIRGGDVTATGIIGGEGSKVNITGSRVQASGIAGSNDPVSLGLEDGDDWLYAKAYTGNVTLDRALLDADTGTAFPVGAVDDASSLARKLLVADTEGGADAMWPGAAFGLPSDLTKIKNNAFEGVAAEMVLVPKNVSIMNANAFKGSSLKRIRFLGGRANVNALAFDGCGKVIAYAIPDTTTWSTLSRISNVTLLPMG